MPRKPKIAGSIAEKLREDILAGKWTDGNLPPERELSKSLGVARLTLRRALKRLRSENLIEVRPGRGYIVVPGAADTRRQPEAREVIFFFTDSRERPELDPIDLGILSGASVEASARGLELYATCQEPAVFRRVVAERKGKTLRGILLDWARRDIAGFLLDSGVPFVVVEDDIEGLPVTAVIQDNAGGTLAILEQMAALGHRRIGLVVNNQPSVHPAQRSAAYREFMLRSGFGVDPGLIAREESGEEGGRRAAAKLLDLPPDRRPTALYVASRGMLPGVVAEMRARGLACPRDISLAAWGEPDAGRQAGGISDVTFVAWDRRELGRMAMLALEDRIRAGRPERMVFRIGARVVDRGSVGSAREAVESDSRAGVAETFTARRAGPDSSRPLEKY
ncbi:MAG: GntR family transcriptional regulator [Planctomycetota bacterium]|nr:GntR family transcriptional regulator [Planctomycetota bacterium]